jgi:hypothetical protein
MMILLFLLLFAGPTVAAEDAALAPVPPTPAGVVTDEDVRAQEADNARDALERAIRRDIERSQNWADDKD